MDKEKVLKKVSKSLIFKDCSCSIEDLDKVVDVILDMCDNTLNGDLYTIQGVLNIMTGMCVENECINLGKKFYYDTILSFFSNPYLKYICRNLYNYDDKKEKLFYTNYVGGNISIIIPKDKIYLNLLDIVKKEFNLNYSYKVDSDFALLGNGNSLKKSSCVDIYVHTTSEKSVTKMLPTDIYALEIIDVSLDGVDKNIFFGCPSSISKEKIYFFTFIEDTMNGLREEEGKDKIISFITMNKICERVLENNTLSIAGMCVIMLVMSYYFKCKATEIKNYDYYLSDTLSLIDNIFKGSI